MRISDWSSDVCSSDLAARLCRDRFVDLVEGEGLDEPIEGKTPGGVMSDEGGDEAWRNADAMDEHEERVNGGQQRGEPDMEGGGGGRRKAEEANRARIGRGEGREGGGREGEKGGGGGVSTK